MRFLPPPLAVGPLHAHKKLVHNGSDELRVNECNYDEKVYDGITVLWDRVTLPVIS